MSQAPKSKSKSHKKSKHHQQQQQSQSKPAKPQPSEQQKKIEAQQAVQDVQNVSARGTGRRKSQLNKDEVAQLRKVFEFFDDDGNGTIEPDEIANKLAKFGLHLTSDEINDIMADLDENDDGVMDFDEFVKLMDRRMSINSQRNEIRETFKVFDKNGDGKVDFNDLRSTLRQLGEDVTDAEVRDMIKQADLNGDGVIDFNEFVLMMSTNESEETKNNLLGLNAK